jgi:hypothetical protein
MVISIINTENKEITNDPKTPDKVFFGLIFVSFFHLNTLPNTYPPTSEQIVRVINQISNSNDKEL